MRTMENENREYILRVYGALQEKGYNAVGQIVGYLLTEDPTYITNHLDARRLIRKIDRYGLLAAMTDLDAKTLLKGNAIFTEFKGALTEQYVCQQLVSDLGATPYYWSAENSSGEVDFVLQHSGNVIPLEVKAEENLQAKSLKHFVAGNELPFGVRTSMSDYRRQEKLINLPLYALSQLWEVCDEFN